MADEFDPQTTAPPQTLDADRPMSPGVAPRGRRLQIAVAVGTAALAAASAIAGILGQEIQYRQMRAVELIAHRCYR